MPHVKTTTVYLFSELDDAAKAKARDWWRHLENSEPMDTDFLAEDFNAICELLGITLKTRTVKLYGGGTRQEPCIWWSGFSSQGDGACYEGRYAYAKHSTHKIRKHAPVDTELHRIADTLRTLQAANGYQLIADIRQQGHYYHAHSMAIDVDRTSRHGVVTDTDADGVIDCLRDLATWYYKQLETEYEYRMSDAAVDEMIEGNEYEFNADGTHAR